MLDVFNQDMFSTVSLTESINKLPYVPSRLGQLGLFRPKPIKDLSVVIEEQHGLLRLLPVRRRGEAGTTGKAKARKARSFQIQHIPHDDVILADDIQGVTEFGSSDRNKTIIATVNDRLADMRQNHEVTHEFHRAAAIQGKLLDADGSTEIYDFFTEFGITETSVNFALGTDTTDVKSKCTEVIRAIQDALGATPMSGVHAMCGDSFFDAFVSHPKVAASYERWREGEFLRSQQLNAPFVWGGIMWENYRGSVDGVNFIPDGRARFFPTGVPGLFLEHYGPADIVEAVNTMGKPVYAKQERMKWDKGVELHTQSNPLIMCSRPAALVEGVE